MKYAELRVFEPESTRCVPLTIHVAHEVCFRMDWLPAFQTAALAPYFERVIFRAETGRSPCRREHIDFLTLDVIVLGPGQPLEEISGKYIRFPSDKRLGRGRTGNAWVWR